MHWLLSIPESFSLREVIRRCGRRYPPAMRAMASGQQLFRVEALTTGAIAGLTIEQVPAGLVLRTDSRLSGQDTEEASQKVWRMLRLEEDLSPFLRLAGRVEALSSAKSRGARLLRGTTLFEDVLTALTTTWDIEGAPDYTATISLVNRLGLPLPSNPTLHAFPTPERVLADTPYLAAALGDTLATRVVTATTAFQTQDHQIEALVRRPLSATELAAKLTLVLSLDPTALGQVMLRLGRYDHIPTDAMARARLQRYLGCPAPPAEREIQAYFDRWHPWGGLAYWLWDWSKVAEPSSVPTT